MSDPILIRIRAGWASNRAGSHGAGFRRIHRKQVQNADHLQCFGRERRWIDQFRIPASLRGLPQRIHNRADTARIHDRHGLQVQDKKNVAARERGLDRAVKLVDRLSHFERPFHFQGADVATLSYVEIHGFPCFHAKFALHRRGRLIGSSYFRIRSASRPCQATPHDHVFAE